MDARWEDMDDSNIHTIDMAIYMEHKWANTDARYVDIGPETCRYGDRGA